MQGRGVQGSATKLIRIGAYETDNVGKQERSSPDKVDLDKKYEKGAVWRDMSEWINNNASRG